MKQRGTKYHPGENVGRGRDDTLFSLTHGHVAFTMEGKRVGSRGDWKYRQYVNVLPRERMAQHEATLKDATPAKL